MLRPLRTVFALLALVIALSVAGCATLYRRQVYHPYRSNYKKPPEKKEAAVDLLPPEPSNGAPNVAPIPPEAAPAPAAPAPGMLDAPPAIPGLPQ